MLYEVITKGWGSSVVVTTLAVGVFALVLFMIRQLRSGHPMLEFRVFKYDMFALTTVINVVVTMALYAAMILLPIYLQNIRGFTPLQAGLVITSYSIHYTKLYESRLFQGSE